MIKGFKMKLYEGMAAEYEKRHNELWPEMQDMIHEHGGKNYSIAKTIEVSRNQPAGQAEHSLQGSRGRSPLSLPQKRNALNFSETFTAKVK